MTTLPATIQERIPLPEGSVPQEGGAGITPGDLLTMLRRRMITIILLWLLLSIVAVGVFFLFYIYFPTYRSEAWIECISNRPDEAETLTQDALHEDEHTRFINSQAALIKSPEVLFDVLKTAEVRSTRWFASWNKHPGERPIDLEEELISTPMRDTNYVRVAIDCRERTDPAKIVDQVVKNYLTFVRNRAKDPFRNELAEYKDEADDLELQIRAKIQQIREFTATLPPGSATPGGGIAYEKLVLYAEQVAALELQAQELEGLSQIYNDPFGPGVSAEDRRNVEAEPLVAGLSNQSYALEQHLWTLRQKFGAKHREVREVQQQLDATNDQLEALREAKLNEVLDRRAEMVRTAFLNAQNALFLTRDKLVEAEATQSDLDRKPAERQTQIDELEYLKESRDRANEFIREIQRVTSDRGQAVQVSVVQQATTPLERSSPDLLLLPAGVVLALILAVGIALTLEFTDTSVRTPQDIVKHLSIAMLGTVPDVDDEEVPIDRVETAVRDAPHSMIAEAFRTIRTNLQFSAPSERQRTLLITSPRPEDGKTTVASNLAASLAQAGRRILLIDANFRRPALGEIYPPAGQQGLSNLLVGEGTLESVVQNTDIANLDVLHTGPVPPNPAERLDSPQFQDMLDTATQRYDQVILDVPPVLLATDATVLAARVDGTILVCRAKENSRGIAQRACELLLRVDSHLFGAVLNAAQTTRGGYFREQMAAFYEYRPEEVLESKSRKVLPAETGASAASAEDHPAVDDKNGNDAR
ncbi:MAG: polysaccharide biosynthesis tyrosine autokinase [bacterium]|nr:polysaccharide biosynthesis tyrosine autokinase [bacterium]